MPGQAASSVPHFEHFVQFYEKDPYLLDTLCTYLRTGYDPKMDGYEIARRLRARPEFSSCVLVALTGFGQESDRQLAREAGFDHHLVKPIDVEKVRKLLETGVSSTRPRTAA